MREEYAPGIDQDRSVAPSIIHSRLSGKIIAELDGILKANIKNGLKPFELTFGRHAGRYCKKCAS